MLGDLYGGSKDEDDLPGEEWRKAESRHFKKVKPFYKFMVSSYGRIRQSIDGGRTYRLADIRLRKYGSEKRECISMYCVSINNPENIYETYTYFVKDLFDAVFPDLIEHPQYYPRFIAQKEKKKKDKLNKQGVKMYKYYTYNIYTKAIKYYQNKKEISKATGLSIIDIDRLLNMKAFPLDNIKIYEVR